MGYGGTKEEMIRLLADAEKLSGVEYDISNLNDVYEAIHVVQAEMGITGTTALEASETISGSLSAMKGAWQNLVGGLADNNADFDSLLDGFIESAVTFGKNVLPRISTFIGGASSLIVKGAQEILPIVIDTLTANLPTLIESGIGLVVALATGLLNAIPDLVAAIPEIVMAIVDGLKSAWPQIRDAGINLLNNFADGMWSLRETLLTKGEEFVNKVIEGVQNKFEEIRAAAADIVEKIKEALEEKMDDLKTKGEQVVGKIKEGISAAWEGFKKWFKGLWDSLFGNLTATATINGTTDGKLAAGGLDFVPYNDFPARLHRGEAVLTAREADEWRRGNVGGGGVVVNQYIQAVAQTPVQLASATEAYFEQARWAFA